MTQKLIAFIRSPKVGLLAVACLSLLWTYWTTLAEMAHQWGHDPQYSHGYLVPGFALFLLWLRRGQLADATWQGTWLGLVLLLLGLSLRLVGAYFYFVALDAVSFLPCLAGLVLLFGGWKAWRWSWPALAFLVFMIPMPPRWSGALSGPLQGLATVCSTYLLQTFGLPAVAQGNTILLNDLQIGVEEACSGLRMLVIFFALATGLVLVVRRPVWEKAVLVVSAIPIALVVNILRITVTGVLYETAGKHWGDAVFHDLAGWLMMPVALGLLGLEVQLIPRLFQEMPSAGPALLGAALRQPTAARGPGALRPRSTPGRRRAVPGRPFGGA